MTTHQTDVAIIGAGPAGLFAVFECGMLGLKCHVVDALDQTGGQCRALYPEKPIYDIPAHPNILAGELIDHLETQASPFNPQYHLGQQVMSLKPTSDDLWELITNQNIMIKAKAVIIAAGVGAFGPNKPPLESIENFEGKSVFYFIKDKKQFQGKRIVIAGGGDSALDWAINLAPIAEHIMLVHRRPKFRAAPDSITKMEELEKEGLIELIVPYQLDGLDGKEGMLKSVRVKTMEGEMRNLKADALLSFFGLAMNLGPIAEWGLNLNKQHIEVDPGTSATSTKGIFAIGDISTYPHKLKLILTGFAEAAQAAHAIRSFIYPDQVFHFEYSTTQGVPK